MENIIVEIMNKFGYLGISLLILIENLFPPIPSEVILTFGGFMTHDTNMTIIGVIITATIGSLLGAIILYYIGRILNKERLKIEAANKVKEAANAASTGKMGTGSGNNINSTERKFLSGLWQK